MFQTTITMFDGYYKVLDSLGVPGFNKDLGCEVRERLQQLDFLLSIITEKEKLLKEMDIPFDKFWEKIRKKIKEQGIENIGEMMKESPPFDEKDKEMMGQILFEIQLYTESFYYFAARIIAITSHGSKPLPGLELLKTNSRDIALVRNLLIEHPERGKKRNQGPVNRSFALGDGGPVIKNARIENDAELFQDSGLYRNAELLKSNLENLMEFFISKHT